MQIEEEQPQEEQVQATKVQVMPQKAKLERIKEKSVVELVANQPSEYTIQVVQSIEEMDKSVVVLFEEKEKSETS